MYFTNDSGDERGLARLLLFHRDCGKYLCCDSLAIELRNIGVPIKKSSENSFTYYVALNVYIASSEKGKKKVTIVKHNGGIYTGVNDLDTNTAHNRRISVMVTVIERDITLPCCGGKVRGNEIKEFNRKESCEMTNYKLIFNTIEIAKVNAESYDTLVGCPCDSCKNDMLVCCFLCERAYHTSDAKQHRNICPRSKWKCEHCGYASNFFRAAEHEKGCIEGIMQKFMPKKLKEMDELLSSRDREISNLRKSLCCKRDKPQKRNDVTNNVINSLKSEVKRLEGEKDDVSKLCVSNNVKVFELNKENNELRRKVKELEENYSLFKSELNKFEKANEKLRRDNVHLRKQLGELGIKSNNAINEHEFIKVKLQLKRNEDEVRKLREALSRKNRQVNDLRAQVNKFKPATEGPNSTTYY